MMAWHCLFPGLDNTLIFNRLKLLIFVFMLVLTALCACRLTALPFTDSSITTRFERGSQAVAACCLFMARA